MANSADHTRIEDALTALSAALDELGVPWMVIGGIAVIAHGVQRMTTDIDAVIEGGAATVEQVIATLRRHDIAPRIDDPVGFATTNLVLLARHRLTEVDLDLSFGWTAFEHGAIAACAPTRYGRVVAPMAQVDDLLVFKAIAGRSRDIDDAVTLLTLYPFVDTRRVRQRVHELAELADSPELAQGLARILAAVTASGSPPRPAPRTRPATPKRRRSGAPSKATRPSKPKR